MQCPWWNVCLVRCRALGLLWKSSLRRHKQRYNATVIRYTVFQSVDKCICVGWSRCEKMHFRPLLVCWSEVVIGKASNTLQFSLRNLAATPGIKFWKRLCDLKSVLTLLHVVNLPYNGRIKTNACFRYYGPKTHYDFCIMNMSWMSLYVYCHVGKFFFSTHNRFIDHKTVFIRPGNLVRSKQDFTTISDKH